MDEAWVDRYAAAWVHHADAGDAEHGQQHLAALLAFMAPDVEYEDVPTGIVFTGHHGVRDMAAAAHGMADDLSFRIVSAWSDGARFAFEQETRGTNTGPVGDLPATGKAFTLRGVSVGTVSEDGLVTSHRDYWDLGAYLAQIGLLGS